MIGLVTTTAAGRRAAADLSVLGEVRTYDVRELADAWRECDALVCFLATGAVVRLVAPLLGDKATDPGVVVVDEAQRHAVALLGGHGGGANDLARRVADVLGAAPVVTTATDAVGLPGLDTLGWPVEGAVAAVSRALLDGEPVRLDADAVWPLPPLPVGDAGDHVLRVTDRVVDGDDQRSAVLRPPSLVLGVGASRGVSAEEVLGLVDRVLADAGLSPLSVAAVATVDAKADEAGLVEACAQRGWRLVTHPAAALAEVEVPNPSEHPLEAVGTPSVAEAAALLHSGGELLVEK
ncbi:MAG TPA: cobalamin biosynthesis protein, partial [Mycobacteriales bacterium]|nr:cobalamin biosynthesis protein [Mycobacteriales bacterium]